MAPHADAWDERPAPVTVGQDEAHVWRARLECSSDRLRELEGWLQGDERDRARRFRFPVHRNRFIARRGALRLLLGRYLQIPPVEVELGYTRHGKPFLARRHATDLRFNLSHSHDLALFVLARGREPGIDLERIRPGFSCEAIAERFFTSRETGALRALPSERRPAAFFEFWVRKEAYLKARGTGLSSALDSFDVTLGARETADAAGNLSDPDDARIWTMHALYPESGYAAALVVEGPQNLPPRCQTFAIDSAVIANALWGRNPE